MPNVFGVTDIQHETAQTHALLFAVLQVALRAAFSASPERRMVHDVGGRAGATDSALLRSWRYHLDCMPQSLSALSAEVKTLRNNCSVFMFPCPLTSIVLVAERPEHSHHAVNDSTLRSQSLSLMQ